MSKLTKETGPATPSKIDTFLEQFTTQMPKSSKLIFAIDATASRQATWDTACTLTASMFEAATASGNLEIQIVYYRGATGECKASSWITDAKRLTAVMNKITCQGGETQIGKVLHHVSRENDKGPVAALVFIGDAVEEKRDALCAAADRLHVPAFMFFEVDSMDQDAKNAEKTFREIAKITGGAFARFDTGAAEQLKALLRAVAAYAAGGREALEAHKDTAAVKLLQQLR